LKGLVLNDLRWEMGILLDLFCDIYSTLSAGYGNGKLVRKLDQTFSLGKKMRYE
jgi:hypothetical protein